MTGHIKFMPRTNVRDKLLAAGLDTIHRLGFNGASVEDITRAAGVPKGSFYNHFESKESFVAAIVGLYWQGAADVSLRILSEQSLPPMERLERYFSALAQGIAGRDYERGCLIGNLSTELADQSDAVRGCLSSLLSDWTRAIERCVHEAQTLGQVRTDLDPAATAAFLVNAWEGTVLRSKVDRDGRAAAQFMQVVFSVLRA
ncbi:MAG: TetR family transcriptional regulator C-terminal domain-containing protein [Gemmatimonadaceae bacterium]|nr:TetR family transcriptional regulator C-terminal domain-containing protein [Gloeobacterales cyanobacterium ES-bin-141]